MRLDRRQPAEFEEASVPQFQRALGTDHGHPLGQVVDRSLQQARLLCQCLLAAHGFADLHLGDVGVEDDQPTLARRPLADLHPAPVVQPVDGRLVALAAVLLDDQSGALGQLAHVDQPRAGVDTRAGAAPQRLETTIEQHDALLVVEQHEGIGNALDGIDQVLVGGFRPQARVAEQLIAALEFGHRLVQRIGTLAYLLGQFHRMLEGCIGRITPGAAGLDPFDQGGVDARQLAVLALQLGLARQQVNERPALQADQWRHR